MPADLNKNYFELFGLPVDYRIDVADLGRRYRELQKHAHPDRFIGGSEGARRHAMQMTVQLNSGFQTLKDPVRRARYLLQLKGVDTAEETDTVMDPAFLMEQMELRERMAEARNAHDRDAMREIADELSARTRAGERALAEQFVDGRSDLARARALVREMQFLQKATQEIESLEEEWT